jgi:hypothetical protein
VTRRAHSPASGYTGPQPPDARPLPADSGHPVNRFASWARSGDRIGHRATSPQRSWPGTASGAPNAVGARNGSQRVQPPSDTARPDQILLAGHGLPVRLSPTVADTLEFPDTEEVTGSNPVRPTIFENLSSSGSQMGARFRANRPLSCQTDRVHYAEDRSRRELSRAQMRPTHIRHASVFPQVNDSADTMALACEPTGQYRTAFLDQVIGRLSSKRVFRSGEAVTWPRQRYRSLGDVQSIGTG